MEEVVGVVPGFDPSQPRQVLSVVGQQRIGYRRVGKVLVRAAGALSIEHRSDVAKPLGCGLLGGGWLGLIGRGGPFAVAGLPSTSPAEASTSAPTHTLTSSGSP
jgi:hypothetical protein